MYKRFLVLFLVVSLLFSLSACQDTVPSPDTLYNEDGTPAAYRVDPDAVQQSDTQQDPPESENSAQPESDPEPVPDTAPPEMSDDDTDSVTVYVTKSGEKYHSDGCQYLRKSKIAMDLKDAKAKGYTLCSKCAPPK